MKASAANPLRAPSEGDLDRFVQIVGEKNAIRDETAMSPFLSEWRDRYVGKAAQKFVMD